MPFLGGEKVGELLFFFVIFKLGLGFLSFFGGDFCIFGGVFNFIHNFINFIGQKSISEKLSVEPPLKIKIHGTEDAGIVKRILETVK